MLNHSISRKNKLDQPRALIIGGSLGGLFAANLLSNIGWTVDIYERSSHDLDSRGGGIVLQPEVIKVFQRIGIDLDIADLGVESHYRTVFRPDNSIQSKQYAPQIQTSWSLIYTTLRKKFGDEHYHQSKRLTRIEQNIETGKVTAYFDDNSYEVGDLLIGADGSDSTVRQQIWPKKIPQYAGYIAWRGLVPESEVPQVAQDTLFGDFGFASNVGSHILGYLMPGENNDIRPGHRLYNWVWYRVVETSQLSQIMRDSDGYQRAYSIPEGKLSQQWMNHIYQEAKTLLPLGFRAVVEKTKNPFVQAIRDLSTEEIVTGRVLLLGDASSIIRPHTAASTSKAAANALDLIEALQTFPNDIDSALKAWEPKQIIRSRILGQQGVNSGNYLLFNRSSTVKGISTVS